ncbi:MAG: omptin family outer membrane protease [Treponema sp.]|jgi:outer membrane protease|nr:omptin family outer membrane protease [Treponema sp.]
MSIFNIPALDNLHFTVRGNEYAPAIEARIVMSGLYMKEMVYKNPSSDDLISAIDWDMGFQMAAGTGFSIGPVDPFGKIGFSLGGICQWYFPVNDRSMNDTDWDDKGKKISYGESPASALAGMEAEGTITVIFPIQNKYVIEVMAELWYGRYAVIAHDGRTKSGNAETIRLYGTAVEYIQEWINLAPGIGFKRKLNNAHIGVQAAVSPFIWGYHIDNHYFRTLESDDPDQKYMSYTDRTTGGIYYHLQAHWLWEISRSLQMDIGVHYRAIENSRGNTTIMTAGLAGYSFLETGTAGAAARTISLDVTIRAAL